MIEQARRRGGYDELVVAELCAFMRERPEAFDAIVSADTLVYFGALEEVCQAAHHALRPGGLFVFTVEALLSRRRAASSCRCTGATPIATPIYARCSSSMALRCWSCAARRCAWSGCRT